MFLLLVQFFMDGERWLTLDNNDDFKPPLIRTGLQAVVPLVIIRALAVLLDYSPLGQQILNTPATIVSWGDPPRYSEEQLIEFRQTGDPSIFWLSRQ